MRYLNRAVDREKYSFGGVGGVRLVADRKYQSPRRPAEPSPVAHKLKSMLHMEPGKEQTIALRKFFEDNPVKGLDAQAKAVLSSYFAIEKRSEIEKRRSVLVEAVPSKTRTAVYSTLRKNDLPGYEGRLVRDVADVLLARDHHAVFIF